MYAITEVIPTLENEIPFEYTDKESIYQDGYSRGRAIAKNLDLPEIGMTTWHGGRYVTVDRENITEIAFNQAYESESVDRDFSPFEFTARELNNIAAWMDSVEDDSIPYFDPWCAFDSGISDGIESVLSKRLKPIIQEDIISCVRKAYLEKCCGRGHREIPIARRNMLAFMDKRAIKLDDREFYNNCQIDVYRILAEEKKLCDRLTRDGVRYYG